MRAPSVARCAPALLAARALPLRRGVPAELRLGARAYPVHAHAWVELDGEPVNEDRETVDRFRALPEVAA